MTADRMCMAQEVMAKERKGAGGPPMAKLNNVLMQMRKNCNHPDLISGAYDGSLTYPSADELVAQVGAHFLVFSSTGMPSRVVGRNIASLRMVCHRLPLVTLCLPFRRSSSHFCGPLDQWATGQ